MKITKKRYSMFWNKFRSEGFTHKQAAEVLKEKDEWVVSLCISDLKKYCWLDRLDFEDSRLRLYTLKGPEEAVKGMKNE